MIREAALRETVSVFTITDGPPDRYGNPTKVESSAVSVPAALQPIQATEDELNRDTRTSRYTVTVAPDAVVNGLARVEWSSRSFKVIGEPRSFQYRNGVHHLEFDMLEILGG